MKRLVLVDANTYLHRAYHALPPLATSKGLPVGALLGFTKTLLKILREQAPDYVAVCFDAPGPTFRHAEFEAYKATRPAADEELKVQLPKARELVEAWGLRAVAREGYEADDLIATLARRAEKAGVEVLIVTSDKDALQLVGDAIRVLDERKGEILDAESVRQRLRVAPEQVVDFLTLVGDVSDNVPGVPGIGPGKAARLLAEFGSLEAVLAAEPQAFPEATARLLVTVQAHRDTVARSRRLLTLEVEAPVEASLEDLVVPRAPGHRLLALLRELEFVSLIPEIFKAEQPSLPPTGDRIPVVSLGQPSQVALAFAGRSIVLPPCGPTAARPWRTWIPRPTVRPWARS